jgi:UDP-N-acetylglucosamine--N-acetylmuramyl-(pentapeptide) pyrophosphoryl-undecaprenol N-acetylglucosamine transferase
MVTTSGSPTRLSVVIAGGGTGGHLYPGIAVARELLRQRPDAQVSFAGTARGLEARVIPREGWPLDLIRSAGLKGKSWSARLRGAALLLPSALDAWRVISARAPSVVVGVGGYSSGPVVFLAALRGIPTMVLEQNAVPGLTNRWLGRVVKAAAVTYDETRHIFGRRGFVAGNPVRQEFFAIPSRHPRAGAGAQVLILGGSQGAHVVNVAVVAAAAELARRCPGLGIVHQTGDRDLERVREGYSRAGIPARVEAFLDPVVDEVNQADLVIGRAGATTLAELAAAGRPAVLVPFAAATDDHQRRNARVLEQAGGAMVIEERELTGVKVADVVATLIGDPARLEAMGQAMRQLARPDAASRIVSRILELAA